GPRLAGPAGPPVEQPEPVQGIGEIRMRRPKRRLLDAQRVLQSRESLIETTSEVQGHAKTSQALPDLWMIRAEPFEPVRQRLLLEGDRLGEQPNGTVDAADQAHQPNLHLGLFAQFGVDPRRAALQQL